jgi:ketosteroid isomerase-like protein
MGEARELADRLTDAVMTLKDLEAIAACYSDNAVAVTPDEGEITGRDGIVEYLGRFIEAFPDAQYEHLAKHESGNVAIDGKYSEFPSVGRRAA